MHQICCEENYYYLLQKEILCEGLKLLIGYRLLSRNYLFHSSAFDEIIKKNNFELECIFSKIVIYFMDTKGKESVL